MDMSEREEHAAIAETDTPTSMHKQQKQQQQIPSEPQNVPFQMIPPGSHFFANPFMTPYMGAATTTNDDAQPPPPSSNTNPPPPMMFTAAQYQEMMQHYFQQMMAASGAQFPIPFPVQFQQPPPQQQQQASSSSTTSPSNNHHRNEHELEEQEQQQQESATTTTTVDDDKQQKEKVQEEEENDPAVPTQSTTTNQTAVEDPDNEEDQRKLSGDRTDSLIRKQMNEIEKEISRRSQNKNIKKIDDDGLAEFIGNSSAASTSATTFGGAVFTDQSALSYTPPVAEKPATSSSGKETLNQLRDSFNLHQDDTKMFANSSPFSMIPQQQQQQQLFIQPTPYNSTNPFVPSFVQQQQQNGGGHNGPASQFSPEQLATVFAQHQLVQQQQQQQQFGVPSTSSSSIAPPPPPTHPVTRRSGAWPDENKENGTTTAATGPMGPTTNGAGAGGGVVDNSVWVLRDAYLKKLGDTNESAEEEMSWHEAATAAQEAAENGISANDTTTLTTASTTILDDQQTEEEETDRLLNGVTNSTQCSSPSERLAAAAAAADKKKNTKETMVHEPAVLIEGVLFRARYLGSTQMLCESRGSKAARMAQAQEAVARVKAPDGDVQPSTEIDLFISTEKIMVLNTDLQRISDTDVRQDILMDHALRTISYIADIGDLVVLMARRMSTSHSDESTCDGGDTPSDGVSPSTMGVRKTPKVICHVFESDEASFIAQSIGQAFQVAYVEFLRANGIDDPSYLRQIDYQEVLNSQELLGDELEMFAKKETQKEVVVPKKAGEPLGIVVVESGWGSMLPTVVLAHMNPMGPAAHSNRLNIGDQIININGISLVGLPLSAAQTQIKNAKTATAVRMTVVSTPPVVEVRIRRPDTKYQLGFSVQNGVICSLLRGGIAERGGIRVGHRIIEINGTSVVAVAHDRIVNMLATAVGEIHMKTMPTSMFRLLTGQEQPQYI